MTSDIFMASYPAFDCDENEVALKNWNALKLADFDFFPHYQHTERYRRAFLKYSKTSKRPLIASTDSSGVIMEGKSLQFIGENTLYYEGKTLSLAKHLSVIGK